MPSECRGGNAIKTPNKLGDVKKPRIMASPINRAFQSRNSESLESRLHTSIMNWFDLSHDELQELTNLVGHMKARTWSPNSLDIRISQVKNLLVFEESIKAYNRKIIPSMPFPQSEYDNAVNSAQILTNQLPQPWSRRHLEPTSAQAATAALVVPYEVSYHSAVALVPSMKQEESAMLPGGEEGSNGDKPKRRKVVGGKNRWTLEEHNVFVKWYNEAKENNVHRKWEWIRAKAVSLQRFTAEQLRERWRVLKGSKKQCRLSSEHLVP